jgi:hypothetical protein
LKVYDVKPGDTESNSSEGLIRVSQDNMNFSKYWFLLYLQYVSEKFITFRKHPLSQIEIVIQHTRKKLLLLAVKGKVYYVIIMQSEFHA